MTTTQPGHEQQTDQKRQQLVAGRYRLLARIGRGRLGEIYEAEDEGHRDLGVERRMAIQLLPDRVTLNQGLFNKLKLGYTELRAAPHPNIVPFLDFDHDGKFGYLVTDFLEGASLRFILDNSATLPLDDAVPVIRAVGDALQFLHANSMVHGRLTAENVFITESLDVRLLDVVPLDSTTAILRGVASRDPFSRCDIADDIYGLACLTYEMLAGRHPFNFHPMAEAHHAELKPARIDSLPEKQWDALCHALSFDNEQRTPAVADFLREFGIKGTERLRPSEDPTEKRDSSSSRPENVVPPTTRSAGPSGGSSVSARIVPATRAGPVARDNDALDVKRSKGKRGRRMPSLVLLMILVGLSAWLFYGQPRDDVVRLIDYVESYVDANFPESGNRGLPIIASDPNPASSEEIESENVLSANATESVADDARVEPTGGSFVAEDTASGEVAIDATDETAAESADERLVNSGADALRSSDDTATDKFPSTSNIDQSSRSEPASTLIQSVAYVSERDGAARITTRHPGNTVGRIFWWTSDNTAIAEKDYIPIDQPVEGFVSGDEAETLHIPLVNDSLPEPQETFYVYLGQRNVQLGHLEPISRIRVEIKDDD